LFKRSKDYFQSLKKKFCKFTITAAETTTTKNADILLTFSYTVLLLHLLRRHFLKLTFEDFMHKRFLKVLPLNVITI
jgi:hypothetical protein